MRVSRLMLVTLRDDPAEAEIASHKLLLRAGYIRRIGSGIYAYLPLLWRVLQKVSAVFREELNAAGALETLLPQLQPSELWQRSGRWAGYTDGEGIMFTLRTVKVASSVSARPTRRSSRHSPLICCVPTGNSLSTCIRCRPSFEMRFVPASV